MLAEELMNAGVQTVITLSELVLPGTSTTVEFDAPKNGYVSWCSMLGATNDGFTCATDALPKKLQTTGGDGYAYDAWGNRLRYALAQTAGNPTGGSGCTPAAPTTQAFSAVVNGIVSAACSAS